MEIETRTAEHAHGRKYLKEELQMIFTDLIALRKLLTPLVKLLSAQLP